MTLAGTCLKPSDHAAWLAERSSGIGASEAAAALGISPYRDGTRLALYLRKLGLAPPVENTPEMRWGHRLEPVIADAYREETGSDFAAEQLFVRHPTRPWMLATLDRVRTDGRIVELKTVGARSAAEWGEPGSDQIPHHYLVQVIHQMVVTGTEVADVAALIGGNDFRVFTVARNDRLADRIVAREAEFWGRVERHDPPPIDPERDAPHLAYLFPEAAGEVEFDEVHTELVRLWEVQGRLISQQQEERERTRTQVLERLGPAAVARLADGRVLARKVIDVKGQTVERKPYRYVHLSIRKGG